MLFKEGDRVSILATVTHNQWNAASLVPIQIEGFAAVAPMNIRADRLTFVERPAPELEEPPVNTVLVEGARTYVRISHGWIAYLNGEPYKEGVPRDFESMLTRHSPPFRRAVKAYWLKQAYSG